MTIANVVFTEGFDQYGPVGQPGLGFGSTALALMSAGEWTSGTWGNAQIAAPLVGSGFSFYCPFGASTNGQLKRDMGVNYNRAVGGIWIKTDAYPDRTYLFITISDSAGNIQGGVGLTSSGQIVLVQNGGATVVATSTALGLGTIHHVTWDFVCTDTGAYNIYLDNTSFGSGTGDFKASTISTWRSIQVGNSSGTSTAHLNWTLDSLWVGDDSGDPLLTLPVVETDFPSGDSAVAFTVGAAAVGFWEPLTGQAAAPGANELYLRRIVCPAGGATITTINGYMQATSAGAKFKGVVYPDSSGTPNAQSLLASASSDTVGATANAVVSSTLATPYAMTGGSAYWIGFITDTSVSNWVVDGTSASATAVKAAATYTSGPPATCPTTAATNTWCIFGTLTGVNNNTFEVNLNPTPNLLGGDYTYVTSGTVSAEDLYTFPNLAITPAAIHCVSIKAYLKIATAGVRTINVQGKSSTTDSTGSLAAVQPTVSYQWYGSYFQLDPNGSIAWTAANVNAFKGGYKIAS